jgi:phosphohistidine phosphatase
MARGGRFEDKEVGYTKTITPNQYIYEAYVTALQEIVQYLYDTHDTVFLVGHNPGVSALAYMLCGLTQQLPTCAIVEIEFDCDSWMDASKDNSKFISYEYPKKHT